MKTSKVQVLVITLLIYKVLSADKCQDDYILRYNWIEGKERRLICCKKVKKNCQPGFYVETCKTDLGKDECTPCPDTKWLVDKTNSTSVHECVQYTCATGSKRIDYLPKTGCNLPCICNLELKYYGYDSCNCKLFEGTCPTGTTLTMNGTCLPYVYAEEINDLRPTEGAVNIPIMITPKVNGTNKNNTNQSKNYLGVEKSIITGIGASVIGLIVISFAVWKLKLVRYKSCDKSNQNDIENQKNQSKGNRSPSTGTDSGVSLGTMSSASALDQQSFNPEQFTPPSSSKSDQHPMQEQTDSSDSSQMLLDSESKDQITTENQTDTTVEQSALREQTYASFELGDHMLTGQCQQIRKQVATVPPFSHENKETDPLLNAANEQMDPVSSTGEIIQQNRPLSDDIPPVHNTLGYTDVRYSFGSRLQMSSFGYVSNE